MPVLDTGFLPVLDDEVHHSFGVAKFLRAALGRPLTRRRLASFSIAVTTFLVAM